MNSSNSRSIWIDIGLNLIRTYTFNLFGYYSIKDFDVPSQLTPGALTVHICEIVKSIDIQDLVEEVIIAIPGVVDHEQRFVKNISFFPFCNNIPLAAWLEIRLRKKVLIITKDSNSFINDLNQFYK